MEGLEIVLDFIIACLSSVLMIVSLISKNISMKTRSTVYGGLLTLTFSVGLIVALIFSMVQKDGDLDRRLSLGSLIIPIICDVAGFVKYQSENLKEKNVLNNIGIEKLYGESVFDNKFDIKE